MIHSRIIDGTLAPGARGRIAARRSQRIRTALTVAAFVAIFLLTAWIDDPSLYRL
jgi:hypothetical protein